MYPYSTFTHKQLVRAHYMLVTSCGQTAEQHNDYEHEHVAASYVVFKV